MSEAPQRGINCQGLDATFEAEEQRSSQLILEARLLQAQQQAEAAAIKYAEAAAIEQRLGQACEAVGLLDKAWVHYFGAVRGWALATNMHDAIALGEALCARHELPERLRQRAHEYVQMLRQRRGEWSVQLTLAGSELPV